MSSLTILSWNKDYSGVLLMTWYESPTSGSWVFRRGWVKPHVMIVDALFRGHGGDPAAF
jgi:hypothetical protein